MGKQQPRKIFSWIGFRHQKHQVQTRISAAPARAQEKKERKEEIGKGGSSDGEVDTAPRDDSCGSISFCPSRCGWIERGSSSSSMTTEEARQREKGQSIL